MKAYFKSVDGENTCYYMVDGSRIVSVTDRFGIKLIASITLRASNISVIGFQEFERIYNRCLDKVRLQLEPNNQ